jgi:gamma-glutamylcyclotransferase (GGCT)/AIG2-like uncharacterized protein YtfP
MKNLFAYGTLMCEDIMRDVSGCPLTQVPGTLIGFSRRRVKGELYPAIIADAESVVEGVVYRDVPHVAWERLDRFEGRMYLRQPIQIEVNDSALLYAETYVVKPEFVDYLEPYEWDFEKFLQNDKASFQRSYKGYRAI